MAKGKVPPTDTLFASIFPKCAYINMAMQVFNQRTESNKILEALKSR